jgi:hypothetical protein
MRNGHSPGSVIRRTVLEDENATYEAIQARLADAGYDGVKISTIKTAASGTRRVIKIAREVGWRAPVQGG